MEIVIYLHPQIKNYKMKRVTSIIIFTVFLGCSVFSQTKNGINKYPFDIDVLNQFSYSISDNDSILPIYNKGKFSYIDCNTKAKITEKEFDEAYPFIGKFALINKNGKFGIIDRNEDYVLAPIYDKFHYNSSNGGIVFDNETRYFSLYSGKFEQFQDEGEPVGPQLSYYEDKKANKFGLILKNNKRTAPVYDSVIELGFNYAILMKSKRIGVIGLEGEMILPFKFTDYVGGNDVFSIVNLYALRKHDTWYYYQGSKKLFESRIRPDSMFQDVIIFKTNGLYNYMNKMGQIMLPKNYKWISLSGNIAINENDEVVLFNGKKEEFVYFKK